MMRKSSCLLLAAALIIGMTASLPSVASALQIVGDPIEGNSWRQRVMASNSGGFDRIEAIMQVGDFKTPGFDRFSASGWSMSSMSGKYLLGIGTAISALAFDIVFHGDLSQQLSFRFRAWLGNVLKEDVSVSSSCEGSGLSIPDPGMLWLLGSASIVFALFVRRKSLK